VVFKQAAAEVKHEELEMKGFVSYLLPAETDAV
jgi:hypothetical protein